MGSEAGLRFIWDESYDWWFSQTERDRKEDRYEGLHHTPQWSSFSLHRYRKRHILLSGFLICAGLILFMTRFIWGIDISGNLSYTDDTLKRFLSSENVKDGMQKSDVNCRKIVQDLRKKYDRIIWVSASVDGCRLVIRIKENEDDFTDSSKNQFRQ